MDMKLLSVTGPLGLVSVYRCDSADIINRTYKVQRARPDRRIDEFFTDDRDRAFTQAGVYAGFTESMTTATLIHAAELLEAYASDVHACNTVSGRFDDPAERVLHDDLRATAANLRALVLPG